MLCYEIGSFTCFLLSLMPFFLRFVIKSEVLLIMVQLKIGYSAKP